MALRYLELVQSIVIQHATCPPRFSTSNSKKDVSTNQKQRRHLATGSCSARTFSQYQDPKAQRRANLAMFHQHTRRNFISLPKNRGKQSVIRASFVERPSRGFFNITTDLLHKLDDWARQQVGSGVAELLQRDEPRVRLSENTVAVAADTKARS